MKTTYPEIEIVLNKIIQTRIKKGLSLENVASELNITAAAYHKIERRKTNLTMIRTFQICEILEINFCELLCCSKKIKRNEMETLRKLLDEYLKSIQNL